jgi:hypothetical protein
VRTKCGFKSASRQMRCTLEWLMPTAFAIDRVLQCVAFGGGCIVVVSTFSFTSADSGFLREGRVLSRRRPSTPVSMYRSCQRPTHGFDLLVSRIIALVPSPSAVASTILARHTCLLALLRSATMPSSRARSAGLTYMQMSSRLMTAV